MTVPGKAQTVEAGRQLAGYRGVRVAVLGAAGFIGRWAARALCARGADLHLLVRDRAAAEAVSRAYGIRGSVLEVDLADSKAVREALREIRPSIAFNLAAYGVAPSERDETLAYQLNAQLVEVICDALLEVRDPTWPGQDLVHVGSALEYGAARGNLSEDTVPSPTTLYGLSKLAGTSLLARRCRADGIRGLTARLFTVYGPGEHVGRLLPSLLRTAETGDALPLTDGSQRRDFTYVEDVTAGLLRLGLVGTEPGEVVNLATGRLTSVRSFVETAAAILGIPADRLGFGLLPTRPDEMRHSEVTLGRLRRLTGWVPSITIGEGIRRTLELEGTHAGRGE